MRDWKFCLPLFVSALILAYLAYKIPLQQVYEALLRSEFGWIAGALVCVFISHLIIAVRMAFLIRRQHFNIEIREVFYIRLISFYYKLFIPGGALANIGVLFYKFSRIRKNRKSEILSVVLFDRLLATIGLSLVGLLFLGLARPELPSLLINCLIVVFVLSLSLIGLVLSTRISNLLERVALNTITKNVVEKFVKFLHSIKKFRNLSISDFYYLLILSLLPHLVGVLAFTAIGQAMGLQLSFWDWGWMRSIIILVTMLPVSLAGLGVRDGMIIYLLHQFSVSVDTAWAVSFLVLAVTVLWPALLGLIFDLKSLFRRHVDYVTKE